MVNKQIITGGRQILPLFILLALSGCWVQVQAKDFYAYRDMIFSKKVHLHMNTPVSFSPRAKTSFKHPEFRQEFFPSTNFKFGLTLIYNLDARYSFSAGLDLIGLSFYSMKRDYFIPAKYSEMYVTPDPMNYRGDLFGGRGLRFEPYQFFWSLPLNFIHRIPVSNKIDLRYALGIDLKVYANFWLYEYGRFYDINNLNTPNAYYFEYEYSPGRKRSLRPDALFSFGLNRYLKNNKYINVNYFVHVPMYKPMKGQFGFLLDTPYEARGTFKKSELAFGFEFNYVFTFVRRDKRMNKQPKQID